MEMVSIPYPKNANFSVDLYRKVLMIMSGDNGRDSLVPPEA